MRAIVEQLGSLERRARLAFDAGLSTGGVAIGHEPAADLPDGPCPLVLLFDRVSNDVLNRIAGARAERRRVLLVSTPRARFAAEDPWRLLNAGGSDVLAWSGDAGPVHDVIARLDRWSSVDAILGSGIVRGNLVGESDAWTAVLRQVIEVGVFTDAAVLVTGESGTGKELVARLVHTLDRRASKAALIVVDCTTVVPTLSGSEFFGHERGAFTGAVAARDGAFARADGGTLVSRRGRRAAAPAPGRALARDPGGHVQAGRRRRVAHHAVPPRVGDQPAACGRDGHGHLPPGPLPPDRGMDVRAAAASRPAAGHPRAREALLRRVAAG